MARRRTQSSNLVFPWERSGFLRRTGLARLRPIALIAGIVVALSVVAARERERLGIRSTRATLSVVLASIDAYRAEHQNQCPQSLDTLTKEGYLATRPIDAWGRPLRLTCPGRRDPTGYELMSDGPDGVPGGLDRIE